MAEDQSSELHLDGGAPGETHTIWMLDDDVELCRMLSLFFGRLGWPFRAFYATRDFEHALLESSPDVAILDLMLPGKTGLQLLAGVRAAGFRFPVVMLSAMGSPSDRVAGLEAGANDYLPKPFLCRELHLRIVQMLSTRLPEPAQTAGAGPRPAGFRWGPLVFELGERRLVCGHLIEPLSRGDAALLLALCTAVGPTSRADLLKASGSLVDTPESRTIDVRLSRLRGLLRKLNNGDELIVAVRGKGYQLSHAPEELSQPAPGH
ncbi:MAG: response regulator transcription factor [Synechococcaceae cyanobacterium]|jgi:two-component system phosphate regulon response regulator OmpR